MKQGQLSSSISQRTCENKGIKDCEAICCYGDEAHLDAEEPRLETNVSLYNLFRIWMGGADVFGLVLPPVTGLLIFTGDRISPL